MSSSIIFIMSSLCHHLIQYHPHHVIIYSCTHYVLILGLMYSLCTHIRSHVLIMYSLCTHIRSHVLIMYSLCTHIRSHVLIIMLSIIMSHTITHVLILGAIYHHVIQYHSCTHIRSHVLIQWCYLSSCLILSLRVSLGCVMSSSHMISLNKYIG